MSLMGMPEDFRHSMTLSVASSVSENTRMPPEERSIAGNMPSRS